jgi:hypothetical protein
LASIILLPNNLDILLFWIILHACLLLPKICLKAFDIWFFMELMRLLSAGGYIHYKKLQILEESYTIESSQFSKALFTLSYLQILCYLRHVTYFRTTLTTVIRSVRNLVPLLFILGVFVLAAMGHPHLTYDFGEDDFYSGVLSLLLLTSLLGAFFT